MLETLNVLVLMVAPCATDWCVEMGAKPHTVPVPSSQCHAEARRLNAEAQGLFFCREMEVELGRTFYTIEIPNALGGAELYIIEGEE